MPFFYIVSPCSWLCLTDPSLALPGLTGPNWDLLSLDILNAVLKRQRKKLLTSIRGHFLLLRYPSPTKWGWVGTDSWDLYQAVPISLAHFTSESDIRPTSRTRVSYNKILLIKDALKSGKSGQPIIFAKLELSNGKFARLVIWSPKLSLCELF